MSVKQNLIPYALAIIIHLVLAAFLLWNYAFDKDDSRKQFVDSPVQAKLVTAPEIPKKDASSLKKRQEKQKEIDDAKKEIERKKKEDQALELEKQKNEQEKLAQAEKDKLEQQQAEQQKLDNQKAEQEKQRIEKAVAEKKRLADIERKKKEALEAKKKAEAKAKADAEKKRKAEEKRKRDLAAKKKREEAERKRKELEALEASLDDELFEADRGEVRQSQIMSEVDKLKAAIRSKIIRNWYIPEVAGSCKISIQIGPGGVLLGTSDNGGDLDYCESGTLAIQKAAPYPSSDDPEVAAQLKNITITFDPSAKN